MSSEGIKNLVSKLVTDINFKEAFFKDMQGTAASAGFDLADDELTALSKLKPDDLKVIIIDKSETGREVTSNTYILEKGLFNEK